MGAGRRSRARERDDADVSSPRFVRVSLQSACHWPQGETFFLDAARQLNAAIQRW